jgi:5-methylcytosine-specific restriction enzyme subunit McrC
MDSITIREYGVLYCSVIDSSTITDNLDSHVIKKTAWDWLLATTGTDEYKFLVKPIRRNNQIGLQVVNYVGVITTPCGCQIEILPKIVSHIKGDDENYLRHVRKKLFTMLSAVQRLKFKSFHNASLEIFDQPLPDVLIRIFLKEVDLLIKKGIRHDYVSVKDETSFLKGRLQVAAQIRQPVGRRHLFQVEYDEFLPDRAENRLINLALSKVAKWSHSIENKRLANKLLFVFDDIPCSTNTQLDFSRWLDRDCSMVHYRGLKEWCELIIKEKSPFSLAGTQNGLSFLFPMNDLFEKYVAVVLRRQLKREYELKEQASSEYLIKEHYAVKNYRSNRIFRLKPDILIRKDSENIAILDCKWKLLDSNNRKDKYKISSSDMYQLYAYGNKYLKGRGGRGKLFLIYPESDTFSEPLPVFKFDEKLELWVVPFKWSGKEDRVCFPTNDNNNKSFEFLKNTTSSSVIGY